LGGGGKRTPLFAQKPEKAGKKRQATDAVENLTPRRQTWKRGVVERLKEPTTRGEI